MGKKKKKKKRKDRKKRKLSKREIQNADIVEIDLGEEIKVGPKQKHNNMLKVDKSQLPKKSKKYTVIKKNKKERKKMQALKITANTVNTDDYVNPLSFDMDLEGPIDPNEMPTIKPYNQDEIVYKEEAIKKDKKKKHKKSKKERKKEKKERKKRKRE